MCMWLTWSPAISMAPVSPCHSPRPPRSPSPRLSSAPHRRLCKQLGGLELWWRRLQVGHFASMWWWPARGGESLRVVVLQSFIATTLYPYPRYSELEPFQLVRRYSLAR